MSATKFPSRPRLATAILLGLVFAWWSVTCWVARDTRPWAIELTTYLFGFSLFVSYFAAWAIRFIWCRGNRRRVAFRAVAATMVFVLMTLLVELPAVVGLVDYGRWWESLIGEWRGPARNFLVDLDLGYRRSPNLHMVGYCTGDIAGGWNMPRQYSRELEFTFNAQGFRSRSEYTFADVVTLGDSYIEGWHVSDGETCSDKLAELTGLSVANLAQSGYGTLQELHMFERHGLELSPRLVVWFFYEGNDLYDDESFENAVSFYRTHGLPKAHRLELLSWAQFSRASFSANLFRWVRRLADPLAPNNMPYFGWFSENQGDRQRILFSSECMSDLSEWERGRFEKSKDAFVTGKALCDEHGILLLVCYIPTKFRVVGEWCEFSESSPCQQWRLWNLPDRFAKFCSEKDIPFLDLTSPMQEAAAAGRLLYAAPDTHWDRAGHAFVAELLAQKCRDYGITSRRQSPND